MEGVSVDRAMADQWISNQDNLRPCVIADSDEDEDDSDD